MIGDLKGFLVLLGSILGGFGMTVLADMANEEIRDRLDHLPHAILRLAARQLAPAQRTAVYHDEWLPELIYILKGEEIRPITRLITGTKYALGILITVHQTARHLHRAAPDQPEIGLLAQAMLDRASLLREQRTLRRKIDSTRRRLHPLDVKIFRTQGQIIEKPFDKRVRLHNRLARLERKSNKVNGRIKNIDLILHKSDN